MGFFSWFSGKDKGGFSGSRNIYSGSLVIDSLRGFSGETFEIILIVKNESVIYNNLCNTAHYSTDRDGDLKFRGPVFKIMLSLTTGDRFDIFYGFVTDDREGTMMDVTPSLLDSYTVNILKEILVKCPGIFDLRYYQGAPTQYTYHLYRNERYYYLTTNRGNDAFCVMQDGSRVYEGDRSQVIDFIAGL